MKIVFATDDGVSFMERHFGDAEFYEVYEVSESSIKYLKRIDNSTEEDNESPHGDPVKAKGVMGLFKDEGVRVLVTKVFGPNIKRIKKKFVCIMIDVDTIDNSKAIIQENMQKIEYQWKQGEERDFLKLFSEDLKMPI